MKICKFKYFSTVFLMLLVILLSGCGTDDFQYDFSEIKIPKVIINYADTNIELNDDLAKEFVDVLQVDIWEISDKKTSDKGKQIINCELYEINPDSTFKGKEEHVATIYFYDNNTALFKTGKLSMNFKVTDDIISQVKDYCTE